MGFCGGSTVAAGPPFAAAFSGVPGTMAEEPSFAQAGEAEGMAPEVQEFMPEIFEEVSELVPAEAGGSDTPRKKKKVKKKTEQELDVMLADMLLALEGPANGGVY